MKNSTRTLGVLNQTIASIEEDGNVVLEALASNRERIEGTAAKVSLTSAALTAFYHYLFVIYSAVCVFVPSRPASTTEF